MPLETALAGWELPDFADEESIISTRSTRLSGTECFGNNVGQER